MFVESGEKMEKKVEEMLSVKEEPQLFSEDEDDLVKDYDGHSDLFLETKYQKDEMLTPTAEVVPPDSQPKPSNKRLKKLNQERKERMVPFKIEDMFQWIFGKQVEAMKPFVTDWEAFRDMAEVLWRNYLMYTGADFDIIGASVTDVVFKKYPMGWGVPLDPKRADETLMITPREFFKRKRSYCETGGKMDEKKQAKNVKKLKIEKMMVSKRDQKLALEEEDDVEDESEDSEEGPDGPRGELDRFFKRCDSASSLSDEHDPDYVNLFKLNKLEKSKVRILRKKKDHEVRYTGGRSRGRQLLMENNVLLLYFSLLLTRKDPGCYCLMDVLDLVRRGAIPYLKITKFLCTETFFLGHTSFQSLLLRDRLPSFSHMKQCGFFLAETIHLDTLLWVDRDPLVARMIRQLNLPAGLGDVVDFVRSAVEPLLFKNLSRHVKGGVIDLEGKTRSFKRDLQYVLFYEVHCLASIFLALRMLLRVDGAFEYEVSKLASRLEGAGVGVWDPLGAPPHRMFVWGDWLRQMDAPPTISSARTWQDLEHQADPWRFFEEGPKGGPGLKEGPRATGLRRSDLVNVTGRFVQPYKGGTHDEVIKSLIHPLATVALRRPDPPAVTDMTGQSIYYLVAPGTFRDNVLRGIDFVKKASSDSQGEDPRPHLESLCGLLEGKPMRHRRLPLDSLRYPRGVFDHMLEDCGMTSSEERLIKIFERVFKIDRDCLYCTASTLDKVLMKVK